MARLYKVLKYHGVRRKSQLFIIFIFLTLSNLAAGKKIEPPLISLKDNNEIYHIGKQVLIFPDDSKKLTLNEILNKQDQFTLSNQEAPSFGFTTAVVWSIFKVKNESDEDWYLEIGSPYQYIIELYSKDSLGKWEHQQSILQDFASKDIKVNQHLLPLHLRKGEERTYYMRDQTSTAVTFPLRIASMHKMYETNHRQDLMNGLCFGLILALSIYNLFVFITIKDRTYLYYVFYIVFFILNLLWIRGYIQAFIPLEFKQLNHSTYPSAAILIFLPLFTTSFLQLRTYAPKLIWMNYIFYFFSSLSIILTTLDMTQLGFNMIMLQVFLMIPYVTILGTYAYKKGFKPARFYLLAFVIFSASVLIFVLKDHGILPYNLFTEYSMQVGNALETLILSFALADKLNLYKKEIEASQELALKQSNDFSRQLIQSQEDERKRIAGELHDSVQQSLGVIKNRIALLKKDKEKIRVSDPLLGNGTNGNHEVVEIAKNDKMMSEIFDVVSQTIQEVRGISYGLRPFQLDLLGLTQSLKSLAEDVSDSLATEFEISVANVDRLFSKEQEINIYRIVQECLNNLVQERNYEKVNFQIEQVDQRLEILLEDDGISSGLANVGKSSGLIGIKERISILGGSFSIMKMEPKGTEIRIQIPLK